MPPSLNWRFRGLKLLTAACACVISASAYAANVWVVTDRLDPTTHADGARVIELDSPASLETELARRLPADPQLAAAIVRQRLEAGGSSLQRRLAAAYQGITDAWSLGVAKIPAVVVDQRYVVYGVRNVARAVSIIDRYRKEHP